MDLEYLLGRVVIFIKVIIKKMKEMDMVKCFGLMALSIKELGNKVYRMDRVR